MKLFAFQPKYHGPQSFFVMADDESEARKLVGDFIHKHKSKNDEYYIGNQELDAWNQGDYVIAAREHGEIVLNSND